MNLKAPPALSSVGRQSEQARAIRNLGGYRLENSTKGVSRIGGEALHATYLLHKAFKCGLKRLSRRRKTRQQKPDIVGLIALEAFMIDSATFSISLETY